MLQQHCFSLAVRALAAGNGAARHARGTLALHPAGGGEPVDAAAFMPAAVRVGLAAECDVQAVRLGLDWLTKADAQLLVCLSWSSLGQDDFLGRLRQLLADRPVQTASSLGAQIHADYVDDDASRVLLREQGACILREGDIA